MALMLLASGEYVQAADTEDYNPFAVEDVSVAHILPRLSCDDLRSLSCVSKASHKVVKEYVDTRIEKLAGSINTLTPMLFLDEQKTVLGKHSTRHFS